MGEGRHPTGTRHAVPESRLPRWQRRLCPAPVFALTRSRVRVCTFARGPFVRRGNVGKPSQNAWGVVAVTPQRPGPPRPSPARGGAVSSSS